MRMVFSFLMTTLDGYHATSEGDLFWHNVDQEFEDFAAHQIDQADTLLFGRKTYQGMAEFWQSPMALEADPGMAARMNSYQKIVVSRTLATADWGPARLISSDVPEQLAKIKAQPGKDIALLGSSELAASLLGSDALDELRVMVNPVILGSGQPCFAGADITGLKLAAVRDFRSGNVLLTYRRA
jgi:dihydrofolate reductase